MLQSNKSSKLEDQQLSSNIALNVEGDFVEAEAANKAHPNINSGDLVMAQRQHPSHNASDDGCSSDDGDSPPEAEEDSLAADVNANATLLQERAMKIDKFIHSLRQFLDTAPPSQLKRLVDEGEIRIINGKNY